jgi:hypothetical protein
VCRGLPMGSPGRRATLRPTTFSGGSAVAVD